MNADEYLQHSSEECITQMREMTVDDKVLAGIIGQLIAHVYSRGYGDGLRQELRSRKEENETANSNENPFSENGD